MRVPWPKFPAGRRFLKQKLSTPIKYKRKINLKNAIDPKLALSKVWMHDRLPVEVMV
jgi:hypothetical protein